MSEIIPEDIREKANAVLSESQWNPSTVQDIARLLLAERRASTERAARINEEEAARLNSIGASGAYSLKRCAATIRNQEQKP